jgi:DNA-binding NtrC family response regulator
VPGFHCKKGVVIPVESTPVFPEVDTPARGNGHHPPMLEIVAGGGAHEPLSHGLRAVRDLVEASDCVLFSILPHGLAYHAGSGGASAHLAHLLTPFAPELDARIQGPCTLVPHGSVRGELDGQDLLPSPLDDVVVFGERVHRSRAVALAARIRGGPLEVAQIRFAQAVSRDVVRFMRDKDPSPSPRAVRAGWENSRFAGLVGASRSMRRLFGTIQKLALSNVNVLILGESGTGKELVARAIHESGAYAGKRFVAQNCAALPEALLESELFGHCKGAFTGATIDKRGLFEEAHGGSFFLDEIADMPMPLQIKLLRVLQEGEIRRVGETRTRRVDVRIIAATNKRLSEEVARGGFREDLFYRLNVVRIDLAPLRRRKEDVLLLAHYFCDQLCASLGRQPLEFSPAVQQRFLEHEWPGNVRELENEIQRIVALHGDEEQIHPYMLSERLRYGFGSEFSLARLDDMRDLNEAVEYLERALIARSLERHGWNKSRAAVELGVSRQGLIKKIQRLQLVRPGPPRPCAVPADETATDAPDDDGLRAADAAADPEGSERGAELAPGGRPA